MAYTHFDQLSAYYREKIWAMIPEVYRNLDEDGPNGKALYHLVSAIAAEAAKSRRSIDRLWEDQNIETCEDWAVPYIADLVGTRLLPALDLRARRVDVARTMHYRRRRGTPGLLETLANELSGWDGDKAFQPPSAGVGVHITSVPRHLPPSHVVRMHSRRKVG